MSVGVARAGMNPPALTPALIVRLERAAERKGRTALDRALNLPGNPLGVTILDMHGLRGSIVASLPDLPWYNLISGLNEDKVQHLPAMLEEYAKRGIAPSISLWAAHLTPIVESALLELRFKAERHSSTLYTVPDRLEIEPAAGVTVTELAAGEAVETFDDVLSAGYGFTNPNQRRLLQLENADSSVRRYLGFVDGIPAAAAALTVHDEIAYLAGAATIPSARGRGAQTALIHRRLNDAAVCSQLVVVTTATDSQSQHNLERIGFRTAQIKTVWASS